MNNILQLDDTRFAKYGKVISGYDFSELIDALCGTPATDEVVYVASVSELENVKIFSTLERHFYGQMPIQIGFCNGYNKKNDYVEYHRSSEINVAGTDMLLVLGEQKDIEGGKYDGTLCETFLVPKGTAVELYATTLHYAPVSVNDEKFKVAVVLPRDTNLDIEAIEPVCDEDTLLVAKNKWLIPIK